MYVHKEHAPKTLLEKALRKCTSLLVLVLLIFDITNT